MKHPDPCGAVVKNRLSMQETQEIQVQTLGWADPLEEKMATHSSILAWKIPWTKEPGGLQSIDLGRVRHDSVTNTFPFLFFSLCVAVVQSLSYVLLFVTAWTAACQTSLSFTISWSLLKLMSVESMMPSNHLILCGPLFLLPLIFPSIRVFSNESALCIRWPKYWSFSFSISPSNEYSGLISFRKFLEVDLINTSKDLNNFKSPDSYGQIPLKKKIYVSM